METVLVINPGSTSTKIAVFSDNNLLAEDTIRHTVEEIQAFTGVIDQLDYRENLIQEFLDKEYIGTSLTAVVGRGGLLKPIPGGTYHVDEALLDDLRTEKYNTHASNLGGILANKFAVKYDIPAFIVDPVVVDELLPVARISGLKGIERRSVGHALNQKAVARRVTEENNMLYENSSVIVAHLGGGISIGAHQNGRMIDVVNGLDGEGPYSPERSGSLPLVDFANLIISNNMSLAEVKALIAGNSGLDSYLGETDLRKIGLKITQGDMEAKAYRDGMCYQVSKSIGEMATVLKGKVDFIVLTGGAVYSPEIRQEIEEAVSWIAPVVSYPGEMEMEALYEGALRVLSGKEEAKVYGNII